MKKIIFVLLVVLMLPVLALADETWGCTACNELGNTEATCRTCGAAKGFVPEWMLVQDGEVVAFSDGHCDLVIPYGVTSITSYVFYGADLKSVVFPETLMVLGTDVFGDNGDLTSVSLPASLEVIGGNPFRNCSKLAEVKLAEGNTHYTLQDGVLFENGTNRLVLYTPTLPAESYTVPDFVTSIGYMAFCDAPLREIVLPASVTRIDASAFEACVNLENIVLPDSVAMIDDGAFSQCFSLTRINIPASLISIGARPFMSDSQLAEFVLPAEQQNFALEGGALIHLSSGSLVAYAPQNPAEDLVLSDNVRTLGFSCFDGCEHLKSIVIPGTVSYVEAYTFWYCTSLETLTIGEGCQYITGSFIYGSDDLKDLYLPASLTSISDDAFDGLPKTVTVHAPAGSYAESYCQQKGFTFSAVQ